MNSTHQKLSPKLTKDIHLIDNFNTHLQTGYKTPQTYTFKKNKQALKGGMSNKMQRISSQNSSSLKHIIIDDTY